MDKAIEYPSPLDLLRRPLEDLEKYLVEQSVVPGVRITIEIVPGNYWFFHPGYLNLRWWWESIAEATPQIYHQIVRAWANYLHEHTYRRIAESAGLSPDLESMAFGTYFDGLQKDRNALIIDGLSQTIFSLREKLAWLTYESLRVQSPLFIPARRIGFRSVLTAAERIDRSNPSKQLHHAVGAFAALGDSTAENFFDLRHALVHRLQVSPESNPRPFFVEVEPGLWDSVPLGRIRVRHVLHLVNDLWRKILHCILALAELRKDDPFLRLNVVKQGDPNSHVLSQLHGGVRVDTAFGPMLLRCMKQRRGYFARIDFDTPIRTGDTDHLRAIGTEVENRIRSAIGDWEPEVTTANFYHGIEPRGMWITFLLRDAERSESAAEAAASEAAIEMSHEGVEPVWMDTREALDRAEQTKDWPAEAKAAFLTLSTGGNPPQVISRPEEGLDRLSYYVVFRSKPRTVERIDGALNLFIFGSEEDLSSKSTGP